MIRPNLELIEESLRNKEKHGEVIVYQLHHVLDYIKFLENPDNRNQIIIHGKKNNLLQIILSGGNLNDIRIDLFEKLLSLDEKDIIEKLNIMDNRLLYIIAGLLYTIEKISDDNNLTEDDIKSYKKQWDTFFNPQDYHIGNYPAYSASCIKYEMEEYIIKALKLVFKDV